MAQFALAQALWETDQDRPRALLLADAALEGYARLGRFRDREHLTVSRWKATHTLNKPTPRQCPAPAATGDLSLDVIVAEGTGDHEPIREALVELHARTDGRVLAIGKTAMNGHATLAARADGQPLDAYLQVTAANHLTTYLEVAGGFASGSESIALFGEGTEQTLAYRSGTSWDLKKGIVAVTVRCADQNVGGAVVTITPGSRTLYPADDGTPDLVRTATSPQRGEAIDFNVPEGPIEIRTELDGVTNRYQTQSRPGAYTEVHVRPTELHAP
jgi:hypothetical protein